MAVKKYCILAEKCCHYTDGCKDLRCMVNKHTQQKKLNFKSYWKSNKVLNALIAKKIQKFREKQEKEEDREGATILPRNVTF